jgi:hypothetical protein
MSYFDLICVCGILLYGGAVIFSALHTLDTLPPVIGLTRIYKDPKQIKDIRILDPRPIDLFKEILTRFPSPKKCRFSSFLKNMNVRKLNLINPIYNRQDWQDRLTQCGYSVRQGHGIGEEAQVSLVWPVSPILFDDPLDPMT